MRMSKKMKVVAVVLGLCLAATSMLWVYASGGPYQDVNPFTPHYDAVVYSFEKGYVYDMGDEYFKPELALSRLEFVTLLGRAAEAAGLNIPDTTTSRFHDMPSDHVNARYVNWAVRKGVLSGVTSDTFAPDGVISREEAAGLALNFLNVLKLEAKTNYTAKYQDLDQVSVRYQDDVAQAIGAKLAVGYRDKQMEPQDPITRGEMAELIQSLDTIYLKDGLNLTEVLDIYVPIIDGLPVNNYEKSAFVTEGSLKSYDYNGLQALLGIDVSTYQGEIDWYQVRNAGVEFAMLRVGGRGYGSGLIYEDDRFEENINGALAAGVNVGAYFFSQAVTVEEAREEAQLLVSKLRGYPVSYPVVFDWEEIGTAAARTDEVSTDELREIAETFCTIVADAGYKPMVYANRKLALLRYDLNAISQYDFWVADYNELPSYYYDFQMWQYTDSGQLPGIKGNVDMNLTFVDYAAN